ncbi:MAG: choloylglycine hydrolase [Clostridiales bacterium]|nr:choloylglycine hydrolase [Clostridiales bacterium]
MCTCIDFKTKDHYFGRNLDLEYRFNENVVITPRKYPFRLKNGTSITTSYAIIGMAAVVENYPLYAEASNEHGLSIAGLYFPGNARFFDEMAGRLNLTPYELIPYFLGQYTTIAEIRDSLANLNITNIPFAPNLPVTALHWMISDKTECIVMEQMEDGLKIYDNPMGVLTNNPPFYYHLANIHNYMNLTPHCAVNRFTDKVDLQQYGNGMGALGLPGDTSPASRFVRAAFNKLNSDCEADEASSVAQFFHILDSVAMVRGATVTTQGERDITTYSCCINMDQGIYYYKTYTNNQITAIRMTEAEKTRDHLSVYPLTEEQQIRYEN